MYVQFSEYAGTLTVQRGLDPVGRMQKNMYPLVCGLDTNQALEKELGSLGMDVDSIKQRSYWWILIDHVHTKRLVLAIIQKEVAELGQLEVFETLQVPTAKHS